MVCHFSSISSRHIYHSRCVECELLARCLSWKNPAESHLDDVGSGLTYVTGRDAVFLRLGLVWCASFGCSYDDVEFMCVDRDTISCSSWELCHNNLLEGFGPRVSEVVQQCRTGNRNFIPIKPEPQSRVSSIVL